MEGSHLSLRCYQSEAKLLPVARCLENVISVEMGNTCIGNTTWSCTCRIDAENVILFRECYLTWQSKVKYNWQGWHIGHGREYNFTWIKHCFPRNIQALKHPQPYHTLCWCSQSCTYCITSWLPGFAQVPSLLPPSLPPSQSVVNTADSPGESGGAIREGSANHKKCRSHMTC